MRSTYFDFCSASRSGKLTAPLKERYLVASPAATQSHETLYDTSQDHTATRQPPQWNVPALDKFCVSFHFLFYQKPTCNISNISIIVNSFVCIICCYTRYITYIPLWEFQQ